VNLPYFFISDVHLRLIITPEEREKRETLIRFIKHVTDSKGTLIIVGDFFDFWFEYKYVMPKAYFDVLTALYQAKQSGIEIHYVLGNHDFWAADFDHNEIFTNIYKKELIIKINGEKFHVIHGDGLLSKDRSYRILRSIIRNRFFIFLFRLIHPDIGYQIARWVSRRGRHNTYSKEHNDAVVNELSDIAGSFLENDADYVIMGHYHQVKHRNLEKGNLILLGDWIKHRSFGYFDGNDFSMNYWKNKNEENIS